MIFRYADPAMDEEYIYNKKTASRRMWEQENFKGECPYCHKPMYDGAYDRSENWVYDEYIDDYAHERCRDHAEIDRESFDEMMGHPMEDLERLVI